MTITIHYSAAAPGAGKTHWALHHMATVPGRYLYAVDRRESIDGISVDGRNTGDCRQTALKDIAASAGTNPVIIAARSQRSSIDYQAVAHVRGVIERAPREYSDVDHVILTVTHEALKGADLAAFRGWNLIIDETPTIFDSRIEWAPATSSFLADNFGITSLDIGGWSKVTPRHNCISLARLRKDDHLSGWANFHRRASGAHDVYADVESWDALKSADRELTWWSVWLPTELASFARVTILANAFDRSVTYKVWMALCPDTVMLPFPIASQRRFQPRTMRIRYFTEAHRAGSYFFSQDTGKACLAKVSAWLAANAPRDMIWTSNRALSADLIQAGVPGTSLTPRQAGSNAYAARTCAAMLYSAKVQPHERPLFAALGIAADDVERSREFEDLYQFACRIAVRDPENSRDLEIIVYDLAQAQYLAETFNAVGYVTAYVELVEIGITDVTRPRRGPALNPVHSHETVIEKKNRERAIRKAAMRLRREREHREKVANGTYVGRGRPKKAA